jgi:hypothetical protein
VALLAEVFHRVYADQLLPLDEYELVSAHPKVTSALLAKIPSLESIAV